MIGWIVLAFLFCSGGSGPKRTWEEQEEARAFWKEYYRSPEEKKECYLTLKGVFILSAISGFALYISWNNFWLKLLFYFTTSILLIGLFVATIEYLKFCFIQRRR